MATLASSGARTSARTLKFVSDRLRNVSLIAAFVAAFNEAGIKSVMASTLVVVGAPTVATGFVYGIASMRQARLAYEAHDRVAYAARLDAEAARPVDLDATRRDVVTVENPDIGSKLDAMLLSRSVLIDTFGDDAAAVAPVYVRIIKQMLRDDEDTLSALRSKKAAGEAAYDAMFTEREKRLREAHAALIRLVGS